MLKEFKEFIAKGNVLDLAVAVIIGAAFGDIVKALVDDLLTPILTPLTQKLSGADFAAYKAGPFLVGHFTNTIIHFLIIAFAMFLVVKAANHFKKPVEVAVVEEKPDHAAIQVEQNAQIIALLEKMAAKS